MEKVIAKITDKDFDLPVKELDDPFVRYASRGIIFLNGKIAVFHKKNKNEYKLPGGGMEDGEDKEKAFRREVFEETGCELSDIEELGITIEEKSETNFRQISYVFKANVLKNHYELHLTKKEMDEGGELLWLDIVDAYHLISNCINEVTSSKYESRYRTLFVVKRDALILENYLLNNTLVKKI